MSGGGAEIDGGVGIEQSHDLRDVRRFSHEAMATVYEVYAVHADRQYAAMGPDAVRATHGNTLLTVVRPHDRSPELAERALRAFTTL